jgi:hypothetical protein
MSLTDIKSPDAMKTEDQEKPEVIGDPKLQRDYTFPFKYVDARGKMWSGMFTNRILSITDLAVVGAMAARMTGGMPAASLDPVTADLNYKAAYMAKSLVKRPSEGDPNHWSKDLGELTDILVLDALWQEVTSHEATFHGRQQAQGGGEGRGTESPG